MASEHEPGQRAYEAYVESAGGRSLVSGDPLPGWESLANPIQHAWRAAADAVLESPDGGITFADGG